jgi:hypothetical protein
MLGWDGTKFEVIIMVTSFSSCSEAAVSEMVFVFVFDIGLVAVRGVIVLLFLLELILLLLEWTSAKSPPVITDCEEESPNAVRMVEEWNRHMIMDMNTTK